LEEALVIAQVRTGNADAFAAVVERYQTPILRYLFRMTGDYELAKDLAQDTFFQAYKAITNTDSKLALKAWLYRIATNNALNSMRRGRLLRFTPLGGKESDPASENRIDSPTENLAVTEALRKVHKEQRVCMVLHFVEGFKYQEIAETLGISEEAVRKRVARGSLEFKRYYTLKEG